MSVEQIITEQLHEGMNHYIKEVDKLKEHNEALRQDVIRLQAELDDAKALARAEKASADMYANAWVRELGGKLIPKTHHIDACVLTTRWMKERSDRLAVIEADMKHRAMEAEYGPHIEQVKARKEHLSNAAN